MGPTDLAAVELVGSSSRVPSLLAILKEVLGQEPSRTQNAKEAVSKGCALCCAMLSPIFRQGPRLPCFAGEQLCRCWAHPVHALCISI